MSKAEIICEAIATRSLLQICYQDHYRIVEPNEYGSDAQGNDILIAYQVEGGGGRDNIAGWRVLKIGAMEKVAVLDARFLGPRPRDAANERRIQNSLGSARVELVDHLEFVGA